MNYRYHLKKYAGKASRLTCPSCGRLHCFSPYVDAEGKEVGKDYGRCDHENSCGYVKYPPSDYQYRERPLYREYKPHQPSALRLSVERQVAQARKVVPVAAQSEDDICTIPFATIRPTIRFAPTSPLIAFLLTIFSETVVRQVISDYCLGTSKAGDTVYYQIDVQGRVRTGKVMKYDAATGHRVKDESVDGRVTWVHALLKAKKQLPADWELSQSLFGEHLLKSYPDKVVALVEAEKTAIIGACAFPEFLWVSVGGKSQLGDKVEVLEGRRIVAFPDLDAHDAWVEKIEERPHLNIQVSDLLVRNATPEDFAHGYDIADFIIRQFKAKGAPKPKPVAPSKPQPTKREDSKKQNVLDLVPEDLRENLAGLVDDFDLVLVNHTRIKTPNTNNPQSNENEHQNFSGQWSRQGNPGQMLAGWPFQGISIHA